MTRPERDPALDLEAEVDSSRTWFDSAFQAVATNLAPSLVNAYTMRWFYQLMVRTTDAAGIMHRDIAEELFAAEFAAYAGIPAVDCRVFAFRVANAVDKSCEPSMEDIAALVSRLQAPDPDTAA